MTASYDLSGKTAVVTGRARSEKRRGTWTSINAALLSTSRCGLTVSSTDWIAAI